MPTSEPDSGVYGGGAAKLSDVERSGGWDIGRGGHWQRHRGYGNLLWDDCSRLQALGPGARYARVVYVHPHAYTCHTVTCGAACAVGFDEQVKP